MEQKKQSKLQNIGFYVIKYYIFTRFSYSLQSKNLTANDIKKLCDVLKDSKTLKNLKYVELYIKSVLKLI